MSEGEVRELKGEDYKSWDSMVEASPQGTVFHKSAWLMASSKLSNKKLKILGYFKEGSLAGGCSFFEYRAAKGLFKIASSTSDMTPYGGFVLSQPLKNKVSERKNQELEDINIIKTLISAIEEDHFDYVRFTNPPEFKDVRPFIWNGWGSNISYAYYLNLYEFDEASLSRDVKRNIKKAIENNLEIRIEFDLSTYYDLFRMTYERQNMNPPVSNLYFKMIIDLLKNTGLGEMEICETPSGEAASAHITLWDNKRAYSWSNASHPELIKKGSNHLLISEISKNLKIKGFKEFNLMRGNVPHLSNFIIKLNPNLVPYYEVEKSSFKYNTALNIKKLLDFSY